MMEVSDIGCNMLKLGSTDQNVQELYVHCCRGVLSVCYDLFR